MDRFLGGGEFDKSVVSARIYVSVYINVSEPALISTYFICFYLLNLIYITKSNLKRKRVLVWFYGKLSVYRNT